MDEVNHTSFIEYDYTTTNEEVTTIGIKELDATWTKIHGTWDSPFIWKNLIPLEAMM